jgi:hypothetical protein
MTQSRTDVSLSDVGTVLAGFTIFLFGQHCVEMILTSRFGETRLWTKLGILELVFTMFCSFWVSRRGKYGVFVSLISFGFLLLIITRSRGLMVLPGTLDFAMDAKWNWLLPCVGGVTLGGLLGWFTRSKVELPFARPEYLTLGGLTLTSFFYCLAVLRNDPMKDSGWPFTRHYYLCVLGLVMLALSFTEHYDE